MAPLSQGTPWSTPSLAPAAGGIPPHDCVSTWQGQRRRGCALPCPRRPDPLCGKFDGRGHPLQIGHSDTYLALCPAGSPNACIRDPHSTTVISANHTGPIDTGCGHPRASPAPLICSPTFTCSGTSQHQSVPNRFSATTPRAIRMSWPCARFLQLAPFPRTVPKPG